MNLLANGKGEVISLDDGSPITTRLGQAGPSRAVDVRSARQDRRPLSLRLQPPAKIAKGNSGKSGEAIDLTSPEADDDDVILVGVKHGLRKRARIMSEVAHEQPSGTLATETKAAVQPQSPEAVVKCPICLEAAENMSSTPCGHVFCEPCLSAALKNQKKCPKCRRSVAARQVHRIYFD